jgi:hypothetical protein
MTKKLMLSLLGVGLFIGVTAPAFAQSDRNRDAGQHPAGAFSQDAGRYDQSARGDQRGHNQDFRSDNRRGGKAVKFKTRYRATIVLTENWVRGPRGPQNVCTVSVRGPQSRLVPKKQLRQIARGNCSRGAQLRITA